MAQLVNALRADFEARFQAQLQAHPTVEVLEKNCISFKQSTYMPLAQVTEDLALLLDTFNNAIGSEYKEATGYTAVVSSLHKAAVRAAWLITHPPESEEVSKLRTACGELTSHKAQLEKDFGEVTEEYKNYMLRTRDWIERSHAEKAQWRQERAALEAQLRQPSEAPISPEMLSPEDTYALIMNIFKRSSKDDLVVQMMQRDREFISLLREFLDIAADVHSEVRTRLTLPLHSPSPDGPLSNRSVQYRLRSPTEVGLLSTRCLSTTNRQRKQFFPSPRSTAHLSDYHP